jgi:hypothetical protein
VPKTGVKFVAFWHLIPSALFSIIPVTTINSGALRMIEISPIQKYLRRADAARYIREAYGIPCVATTLAKYASIGGGPAFRKAGKFPIYSRSDLDAWAEQRFGELVRSTSELSDQRGGRAT